MPIYSTRKLLAAQPTQIPQIAEAIRQDFQLDEFEVNIDPLMSGGRDISITKGNVFKAVLGMRTALKVTLIPHENGILFDANVGIYGQQAIPTIISMLFFWPVLITQIWGLVEQSSLDDRALAVAERAITQPVNVVQTVAMRKFCTHCGTQVSETARFCPECGRPK